MSFLRLFLVVVVPLNVSITSLHLSYISEGEGGGIYMQLENITIDHVFAQALFGGSIPSLSLIH